MSKRLSGRDMGEAYRERIRGYGLSLRNGIVNIVPDSGLGG
jgi:hypothetical protein